MTDKRTLAMAVAQSSTDAPRSAAATALLPKFLVNREHDVSAIHVALEHGDFATIARIGHNLRGNGRSYGFPEIGSLGEDLEVAANTFDDFGVRELVALLEKWRVGVAQRERTSEVRLRTMECDKTEEARDIAPQERLPATCEETDPCGDLQMMFTPDARGSDHMAELFALEALALELQKDGCDE